MTIAYILSFALLVAALVLAIARVERGPSMFDRILAVDVNAAAVLGIVAVTAAATKRADLVPVLVALALIGFIYSVTVARFAAAESAEEGRILSKEELRAIDPVDDDDDSTSEDDSGVVIAVEVPEEADPEEER
ncbi:MAG TPA: monovalent cation/H+ antiporter complex subunit F [Actinomycetaceae bacterium]|nr:monovalent cation/H+ antiporter complex subunit F [Actinomycetaceae bacterium]